MYRPKKNLRKFFWTHENIMEKVYFDFFLRIDTEPA